MAIQKELKPLPSPLPFQTPGEEIANSILHGLGILLAAAGLVLLAARTKGYLGGVPAGSLSVVSYVIFSAMLITMFLASTLYHAIQAEGAKRVFRILDHSSVYFLIAGTYTPFSLLGFGGALGWVYFGIEWALAITGAVLYAVNCKFLRKAELAVYVMMGWAIAAGTPKLFRQLPLISFILLFAGGIAYTAGIFWYKRSYRRAAHVVWHIHVVTGAFCHWLSMWFMS